MTSIRRPEQYTWFVLGPNVIAVGCPCDIDVKEFLSRFPSQLFPELLTL